MMHVTNGGGPRRGSADWRKRCVPGRKNRCNSAVDPWGSSWFAVTFFAGKGERREALLVPSSFSTMNECGGSMQYIMHTKIVTMARFAQFGAFDARVLWNR